VDWNFEKWTMETALKTERLNGRFMTPRPLFPQPSCAYDDQMSARVRDLPVATIAVEKTPRCQKTADDDAER
jgi:hypothetical protein